MGFNVAGFMQTLPIMGYGMLGIFVVMIVIYCCIRLLGKLFPEKSDKQ